MKAIKYNSFYCLIVSIMIFSCTPSELKPGEYVKWIKDYSNGIHKSKKLGTVIFDVQYKPAAYIAAVETRLASNQNKEAFNKRLLELEGMDYIELTITDEKGDLIKSNAGSQNEMYQLLYYYSFEFQNHIQLLQNDKNIPCKLFHFERSYELAKERKFILGFEKNSNVMDEKVLVIDSPVLGTGAVKIKFESKDLKSIPQIRL